MVQRIRDVPPGTSPEAAQQVVFQATLALYFEITGFRETNPMAIGHHVVSLHGPPCGQCGVPVRTPRARMCTACGAPVRCH